MDPIALVLAAYIDSVQSTVNARVSDTLGTGPEFWINLQKAYELDRARALLGAKLNKIQGWESTVRKAG